MDLYCGSAPIPHGLHSLALAPNDMANVRRWHQASQLRLSSMRYLRKCCHSVAVLIFTVRCCTCSAWLQGRQREHLQIPGQAALERLFYKSSDYL